MESIKEALIELTNTTKENNKEEKVEVGKEAVKKITEINEKLTLVCEKDTTEYQQQKRYLEDIMEEPENDSSLNISGFATSTQVGIEASFSPLPKHPNQTIIHS